MEQQARLVQLGGEPTGQLHHRVRGDRVPRLERRSAAMERGLELEPRITKFLSNREELVALSRRVAKVSGAAMVMLRRRRTSATVRRSPRRRAIASARSLSTNRRSPSSRHTSSEASEAMSSASTVLSPSGCAAIASSSAATRSSSVRPMREKNPRFVGERGVGHATTVVELPGELERP